MDLKNEQIIEKLYRDFDLIQSKLRNKPILGAQKWHMTDYEMLNSNGLIKVSMEDGHIKNDIIVKYSEEGNFFEIIKEE